jgi:hypothetical protein
MAKIIASTPAGPTQPSSEITQCLNGGYGWLQIKCRRCETYASIPLEHSRRPRDTRYGDYDRRLLGLESDWSCRRHHALYHTGVYTKFRPILRMPSLGPELLYSRLDPGLNSGGRRRRRNRAGLRQPGHGKTPS